MDRVWKEGVWNNGGWKDGAGRMGLKGWGWKDGGWKDGVRTDGVRTARTHVNTEYLFGPPARRVDEMLANLLALLEAGDGPCLRRDRAALARAHVQHSGLPRPTRDAAPCAQTPRRA